MACHSNLTLGFFLKIMAADFEYTYVLQLKGNKLTNRINTIIDNAQNVTSTIAPIISLLPFHSGFSLMEISRIVGHIDPYN